MSIRRLGLQHSPNLTSHACSRTVVYRALDRLSSWIQRWKGSSVVDSIACEGIPRYLLGCVECWRRLSQTRRASNTRNAVHRFALYALSMHTTPCCPYRGSGSHITHCAWNTLHVWTSWWERTVFKSQLPSQWTKQQALCLLRNHIKGFVLPNTPLRTSILPVPIQHPRGKTRTANWTFWLKQRMQPLPSSRCTKTMMMRQPFAQEWGLHMSGWGENPLSLPASPPFPSLLCWVSRLVVQLFPSLPGCLRNQ